MSKVIDDPRRAFLVDALAIGLFASANGAAILQASYAMGSIPDKLPAGRSIYRLEGTVTVDDQRANINTKIGPNSLVRTGPDSLVIFVVESDAFILRANSELKMGSSGLFIEGMRLLTGKILSVFGEREVTHSITTSTATIGIRGTGIYIESDPGLSYVCTCYGHTQIIANADPNLTEDVVTRHHDRPLYILPAAGDGNLIVKAPVYNHSDTELSLIESLVGRKPPFAKVGKKNDGSGFY